ncbi:uncharacterized protein LOC115720059 [Cannabis sativa]|uniref:uncharacterized protein LOC115720059 n=1 Tax=Cannabis sativa TaxID=3483 RepID=UPI0029CA0C48|nr:uncharacterized protein LOC115720059 [Cannabis sativa]
MKKDCVDYVLKYDSRQRFENIPRALPNKITLMTSPWPFAVWGIDLSGSLLTGKGGVKYAIVAMGYFTKWTEAEPMKTFDCEEFTNFCNQHGVIKSFSAVARLQTNGQAEAVNKILKVTLKKKLLTCKNNCPKELQQVLWAYRTIPRTTTRLSPFSMVYECEAIVPVETLLPSHKRATYDPTANKALLQEALYQIDELRDESQIRMVAYQRKVEKYFNAKVKDKKFTIESSQNFLRLGVERKTGFKIIGLQAHEHSIVKMLRAVLTSDGD